MSSTAQSKTAVNGILVGACGWYGRSFISPVQTVQNDYARTSVTSKCPAYKHQAATAAKPTLGSLSPAAGNAASNAAWNLLFGASALQLIRRRTRTRTRDRAHASWVGRRSEGFDASIQPGATEPLGFFDPLNFSKDEKSFLNYRAAELKHGRVAMLAAVGACVQHYVNIPFFEDVPRGVTAVTETPGDLGFGLVVLASGMMELFVWNQDTNKEPGDFNFDPLSLFDADMQNREINNGRLAMICALGIIGAELATGQDAIQQLGLSALGCNMSHRKTRTNVLTGVSNRRERKRATRGISLFASSSEGFDASIQPGATEPLGFFDPLNFSKDEKSFLNYRAAELKHGRVAMLAAVGACVQHYVHIPFFEEVPRGVTAVTETPGDLGFGLVVLASGIMELFVWNQDTNKEPGDFNFDPLSLFDADMQNREINNGRLAMICALGIIGAELATGQDAIQQLGLSALGCNMSHRRTRTNMLTGVSNRRERKRATRGISLFASRQPDAFNPSLRPQVKELLSYLNIIKDEQFWQNNRAAEIVARHTAVPAVDTYTQPVDTQHFVSLPCNEGPALCYGLQNGACGRANHSRMLETGGPNTWC